MRVLLVVLVLLPLAVAPALAAPTEQDKQKLALDIKKLEQDTSWDARWVRPYIPLLSVAAALVAAVIGVSQYRADRKRERELRVEEGVAKNLEELVSAPTAPATTNARAVSALRNLAGLTAEDGSKPEHARRVTEAVTALVQHDLVTLDSPQKARLPAIALDEWPAYCQALASNPAGCRRILERYRRQLATLHAASSPWFSDVERDDYGEFTSTKSDPGDAERQLFEHLVEGYRRHVAMLPEADRAAAITVFSDTLHNTKLRDQVFA